MGQLQGKVAYVTGGTAGIGEATVRIFVNEGAQVLFTGTNTEAGDRIARETGATFLRQDVADPASYAAVAAALERFGRLDIAFANAGINKGDSDIETVTLDSWRNIFAVNVEGVLHVCQTAIARMKQNPGGSSGSIIINSSVVAMAGLPGDLAYTASKGAVRSMAKAIAIHCARQKLNIRCNSIHPGIVLTPNIQRAMVSTGDPAAAQKFLESAAPLGRLARSEEIADLVCYLASDRSTFVTGAEWVIDGGSTAGFPGV
jgi:3(or 17)beta-hydroxysteroid dehydrogenase